MGDWYGVILVVIYSFSDFASRLVFVRWITVELWTVAWCLVVKALLIPLASVAVQFFSNPFVIAVLVSADAASHGFESQEVSIDVIV